MTIRLLGLALLVALPVLGAVVAWRRRARLVTWALLAFAASEFAAQMPVRGGVGPARLAIGAAATAVSIAAAAVLLAAAGVWVSRRSLRVRLVVAVVVLLLGVWAARAARPHPPARPARASLEIHKAARTLTLRRPGEPPQTYRIALGDRPRGDKQVEGDQRTPEGEFIICAIGHTTFDPFLRLNYPAAEDAVRGRRAGLITWLDFLLILRANRQRRVPPQRTNLGGAIGIHGGGTRSDWTLGCIALDDAHVHTVEGAVAPGTPVRIRP